MKYYDYLRQTNSKITLTSLFSPQRLIESLKRSDKKEDIAIYLEALSHIGAPEALPVLAEYAYGVAENIQKYSPKYIDFVKSVSLYALHNVIRSQPEEVTKRGFYTWKSSCH